MSAESPFLTIDASALQETLEEICAGHDRLEKFLHEVFGNLDSLAEETVAWERRTASERQSLDGELTRRQERLSRERQEVESTYQQFQELAERLAGTAIVEPEGTLDLRQAIEGLQHERSALLSALESAGSPDSHLGRMAEELAAARRELAEAREEIRSQREIFQAAPEGRGPVDSRIESRLEQLEEEQAAWAKERAVLETELDSVRTRAAELADTLEDERRRVTGERKEWADELRRLRQLLERMSDRPSAVSASAQAPAPKAPIPQAPSIADSDELETANDPVLNSVMAQFEILQKDLARQRKAQPAGRN